MIPSPNHHATDGVRKNRIRIRIRIRDNGFHKHSSAHRNNLNNLNILNNLTYNSCISNHQVLI